MHENCNYSACQYIHSICVHPVFVVCLELRNRTAQDLEMFNSLVAELNI